VGRERRSRLFQSIAEHLLRSLLESELFGYMKGSFTGAVANQKGLFEAASSGSIFLDEIGETSLSMQVKIAACHPGSERFGASGARKKFP